MRRHSVPEEGGAGCPCWGRGTPSPASSRAEEMNLSSWHLRKSRSSSRSSMRFCSQEFLSRARCSWARTPFIRATVGEAASAGSRGGRPWSHPRPQGPQLVPHGTQSPASPLTLEVTPRGAQAVKDLWVQVGGLIERDGNLQGLAVLLHWRREARLTQRRSRGLPQRRSRGLGPAPSQGGKGRGWGGWSRGRFLTWPPPAVHGAAFCRPRQLSASGPLDKRGSHRWRNTDGHLGAFLGDLGRSTWGGLLRAWTRGSERRRG